MRELFFILVLLVLSFNFTSGDELASGRPSTSEEKMKKMISVFNIVKFDNSVCEGTDNKNGTCYTKEECENRGGRAKGTCASGYGVCCIINLSCGGTSSDNCTYIEQASFNDAASLTENPCTYKLCRPNNMICRIRLDFITHKLSPPTEDTSTAFATAATTTTGNGIGDCSSDSFTFTSPGKQGSPTICGYNSGQHMILDASTMCNELRFTISPSSGQTREWNIKATMFMCGDDESAGGPPGCLQYFTGDTGSFASFNFDTISTTVALDQTHLSNQLYSVCFRRNQGNCRICYSPHITATPASFGVSTSASATAAQTAQDTACTTDFLVLHEGQANTVTDSTINGINRVCGRIFASAQAGTTTITICSLRTPFRVDVHFDADEVTTGAAANNGNTNELNGPPSGTMGYWLDFIQMTCA